MNDETLTTNQDATANFGMSREQNLPSAGAPLNRFVGDGGRGTIQVHFDRANGPLYVCSDLKYIVSEAPPVYDQALYFAQKGHTTGPEEVPPADLGNPNKEVVNRLEHELGVACAVMLAGTMRDLLSNPNMDASQVEDLVDVLLSESSGSYVLGIDYKNVVGYLEAYLSFADEGNQKQIPEVFNLARALNRCFNERFSLKAKMEDEGANKEQSESALTIHSDALKLFLLTKVELLRTRIQNGLPTQLESSF